MSKFTRAQGIVSSVLVLLFAAAVGYISLLARSTRRDYARMDYLDHHVLQSSQLGAFMDKVDKDRQLLAAIRSDDAAQVAIFFKQGTTIHKGGQADAPNAGRGLWSRPSDEIPPGPRR